MIKIFKFPWLPFKATVFLLFISYVSPICRQILLRAQPNEACHVLEVPEEGAQVSPGWFSFTGEALTGLPAVPSELRFTRCTAHSGLGPASPCRFLRFTSHATWTGTARCPAADGCEDDNSENDNAAEQETEVCRCELLLANQSS